jgi:hypothetical protein
MQPGKLALHSHILPTLQAGLAQAESEDKRSYEQQWTALAGATIFDCRKLPHTFVLDTGDAAFDEAKETNQLIRLPFQSCYFELKHDAVLAQEVIEIDVGNDATDDDLESVPDRGPPTNFNMIDRPGRLMNERVAVQLWFYMGWEHWCSMDSTWNNPISSAFGKFYNFEQPPEHHLDHDPFFECVNLPSGEDYFDLTTVDRAGERLGRDYGGKMRGLLAGVGRPDLSSEEGFSYHRSSVMKMQLQETAKLLLGVLTLMNEHLLGTEIRPDPSPQLTRARLRRGRLPLYAQTRVLTINLGSLRRLAKANDSKRHESPSLHWRRGHWRALHRGSEFEGRTG